MLTKRQSKTISSSYKTSESSTGKCGFTLVELLIVIVVGLIITAGVVSILWVYIFDFEQTDDITAARQRGEMVLSILEGPILHAGLGMPNESPDFADSFNAFSDSALSDISSMDSPIRINGSNDEIYICYSMPSSNVITDSVDFSSTSSVDITMNEDLVGTNIDDVSSLKSWLTFPTANVPFHVTSFTSPSENISIETYANGSGIIAQYDELHYLRAIRALVQPDINGKNAFYTEDLTISSAQPRVDGVEKIYFVNDGGVLSVYVLTRGNKIDVGLETDRPIPGWDESILPTIDANSKKYRLSVTKGSWRIRN